MPKDDPNDVEIDFRQARLMDHSAIEAVSVLAERYQRVGKRLRLTQLNPACRVLLDRARTTIDLDDGQVV